MADERMIQTAINTIRTLSIDAVQQAKSGHPGTAMALAPLVYTLWNRVMNFDPQDPIWPNRDRFVLSNGHASMLLWSGLYLSKTQAVDADYEVLGHPSVSLDDIRRFRQLDSHAPGHPEYHWVSGVETTTATVHPTNRTRPKPTANRSARRKSGSPSAAMAGRKTRSFSCRTACTITSRLDSGDFWTRSTRSKWPCR